ncbi:TetR family transcriptional regulator [Kitasatospora sp. NPDC001175]|uniref:TetR family transcriptional regulator n=1 Tax=Kitasatospora sp. NPDC001175 TaxID=3157103 RepID=UPI003D04C099
MQERAARTRQDLICAAAREFDRNGYAGSSLADITRSAGISMGALTFHFRSKQDLAAEVRAEGQAATLAVVGRVAERREDPVRSVVSLTVALAELLEQDVAVRAAARLAREQPGVGPDWSATWAPVIQEHLGRTGAGRSGPAADRTVLATLADYLLLGAEDRARRQAGRPDALDDRTAGTLARIWEIALRGLATESHS